MTLDLDWDDGQQAVAAAVAQYARDRWSDEAVKALLADSSGGFPNELWADLAELGVLAVMTPEGDGGPLEAVAALEALGRHGLPGPLVDTLVATQVLGEDERRAVATGQVVAVMTAGDWIPWPERARIGLAADADGLTRVEVTGQFESVETLGGEPWGHLPVQTGQRGEVGATRERLDQDGRARAVGELALATLMAAAGAELIERAAEHARTRSQFGRPIGEFQAVAHPLADAYVRQTAAVCLCRAAAFALDLGQADANLRAAAARMSARGAALEAVHTAHQIFGAVGITLEGPVFHLSRRIRQWASHPLPTTAGGVLEWMARGASLIAPVPEERA